MLTQPLSVVLPVRDGQGTIDLALADLLAGLSNDDELLVIDDGSGDQTPELLRQWGLRDPRLRVITRPSEGLVSALNLGVREATYKWIARADADDRYPLDRFASQRAALDSHVALVTGDYSIVGPGGTRTYIPCALTHPFVAASLINPQRIPHPGVVLNREAVIAAGGYSEDDFPTEDLALWLRLSAVGTFVGVPSPVVSWYLNPGSVTHSRQVVQRSQTANLLRDFKPTFMARATTDALKEELDLYEATDFAGQRAVLLSRDLVAWRRRGYPVPGAVPQLAKHLARHPGKSLLGGLSLTSEKWVRRRERAKAVEGDR